MKPVELRFHRPRRATLNKVSQTVIAIRDDAHDSIALHALLQKEAVEETVGPTWIRRDKDETRAELSIALDAAGSYLELACDQVLSMLYIGVVDSNHQGLSCLRRWEGLSRSVKSLGLEIPAYSQRVTPNRHVACTHIAEAADLKDPGCRAIRHPSAELGEQIAQLRRCPPRNDFTEREVILAVPDTMVAAATGPIPASPKSKGTENCLNAFGADVLNALRFSTIHARLSAEGIGVCLAANDLDLDSAQQLLTFLESQPDLLRRQVGDWASDRANVVRDWRVAIRR